MYSVYRLFNQMWLCRLNITLFLLLITLFTTVQAATCTAWNMSDVSKKNLVVGKTEIVNQDIFDLSKPKESRFIHHMANKLHAKTKASVIHNQLLFATGEPFEYRKLEETERLLRSRKYIKNAQVYPLEICNNTVSILVVTTDNWTLTPGVSFGRSGGNNRSGFEIQEHNLFGLGKSLALSYKQGADRNSTLLTYNDEQLFGSRKKLTITLQDNSDGKGYGFALGQPFYAFDTQHAWGIDVKSFRQDTSLFSQGDLVTKIKEDQEHYSAFYGWAKNNNTKATVTRFKVGWTADSTRYLSATKGNTPDDNGLRESYPWFEISNRDDRYIQKTNFKSMGEIEDIALGKSISARLGILTKGLGSDNNYLKLRTNFSKGFKLGETQLAFLDLGLTSYLGNGARNGGTLELKGEWDHFNHSGNDLYLASRLQLSDNLRPAEQLVLGGETGLRGYPRAIQTGNKTFLVQAEKRFHFSWYPLHAFKYGAVIFSDVGSAWGKGNKLHWLTDVGVGLRMIATRSSSSKAIHLDLAFPLLDRGKVDKMQLLIKTSKTF